MPRKIEISHRTIIFAVVFLITLWFLFFIRDILLTIFVSLMLMAILNPVVTRLTKWKIPRVLAVVITYILMFGVIGFIVFWVVPPLVEQTTNFVNNFPYFLDNLGWEGLLESQIWDGFLAQIGSLPSQVLKLSVSVFSNILAVLSILFLLFYFLLYRSNLDEQLSFLFGEDGRKKAGKIIDKIEKRLGSWARSEILLMFIVGALTYLGLFLLGIPFALPLSIIAGLLEIVPILGPNIAAIPGIIIGFTISPLTALGVAALAFLIQQVENYLLVPKIMQKSVGVNPIVTLLSLTIGYRLLGLVGALISVPLFLTIQIVAKEYFKNK